MHCYRVTTYNPAHPVYILRATMQQAFELARANTTRTHSPVVALIDLPTNKDSLIDQLNDPQQAIGDAPSLKAWEFTPSARGALAHELAPNEGSRIADVKRHERAKRFSCKYCGGNDEEPQDHCMDCPRPSAKPVFDGGPLREGKPAWPFYKPEK